MSGKKNKRQNISIDSIGVKAVSIHEELSMNRKIINASHPDTVQKVKDYIFGVSDENPYEEITKKFYADMKELEKRVTALGKPKPKRGLNV
jgi:hypothetical protein